MICQHCYYAKLRASKYVVLAYLSVGQKTARPTGFFHAQRDKRCLFSTKAMIIVFLKSKVASIQV